MLDQEGGMTDTLMPPVSVRTADRDEVRASVLALAEYAERSYVVIPRRLRTLIADLAELVDPMGSDVIDVRD
jgi:hypothetical protein